MMKFTFVPDYFFDTFDMATAELLTALGIKGIILDVDNTLEPYENPLPGDHVMAWLSSLAAVGIKAVIVSNNNAERIDLFNTKANLPAFSKAGKPFKKNLIKAMEIMNTSPDETIVMGDQVFTDVWAARNAGVRAILVPPINDKRDPLTRFKRLLEKPVLRKYERIHGK